MTSINYHFLKLDHNLTKMARNQEMEPVGFVKGPPIKPLLFEQQPFGNPGKQKGGMVGVNMQTTFSPCS